MNECTNQADGFAEVGGMGGTYGTEVGQRTTTTGRTADRGRRRGDGIRTEDDDDGTDGQRTADQTILAPMSLICSIIRRIDVLSHF